MIKDPSTKQKQLIAEYKSQADRIITKMINVLVRANNKIDETERRKWIAQLKEDKK